MSNASRPFVKSTLSIQNKIRISLLQKNKNLTIGGKVRITPLTHFKVGKNVSIDDGVIFDCGRYVRDHKKGIRIGDNSYIGYNCVILGGGGVEIGRKVIVAPGTVITSQGHSIQRTDKFIKDQETLLGKVVIEDDVWIGANSSVLPGVTIGKGSVVGAGSVVNRDIPEYSVAVGVPARVIKSRKNAAIMREG